MSKLKMIAIATMIAIFFGGVFLLDRHAKIRAEAVKAEEEAAKAKAVAAKEAAMAHYDEKLASVLILAIIGRPEGLSGCRLDVDNSKLAEPILTRWREVPEFGPFLLTDVAQIGDLSSKWLDRHPDKTASFFVSKSCEQWKEYGQSIGIVLPDVVWKKGDAVTPFRKRLLDEASNNQTSDEALKRKRREIATMTDAQAEQKVRAADEAARLKAAQEKREAEGRAMQEKREAAEKAKREAEEARQAAKEEAERIKAAREEAAAKAKERREAIASGAILQLKASDLSAQTHKWDGKRIITRLSCFYADVSEFRCIGGGMRIDFSSFAPEEEEERLTRDCDTISKSMSPKCNVKILFTYKGFASHEVNAGFTRAITMVIPENGEGEILK